MTIDERLDRLTERHEALTQTVELMLQSHQMHSERLDRIETILDRSETMLDLSLQQQKANQEVLSSVVRRIENLVTIMEHHETRLSRLESPGKS